ncbi:MAG: hypothetical protein KAJ63_00110 [Methyloprofundus sp.]|nr:hypothetical protein [Methyloprofundus sp.]
MIQQKAPSIAQINTLKQCLSQQTELELAILIGSQAQGKATAQSDWDFAIRWQQQLDPMQRLGKTETLRRLIAKQLKLAEAKIDLIDLNRPSLTMRAVVAEEGLILKGEESLAWAHFLQRTWRELESFYWEKIYAT